MAVSNLKEKIEAPSALTEEAFASCMADLPVPAWPTHLAVAVSGGADSMALALLAHRWAKTHGIRLTCLTVNHGLRPEAADEAEQVKKWLEARGIEHETLEWLPAEAPTSNIQAKAREARYGLMADWCKQQEVNYLLVAHHLEDQAETFLIRLQRGSGVDGLSAMQPSFELFGMTLLRPLLSIEKNRLRETLRQFRQHWAEDPSNQNPIYKRVRLRNLLPVLTELGISPEKLADTASRMQRARSFLHDCTEQAMEDILLKVEPGHMTLNRVALAALHPEIGLRALSGVISRMCGTANRPRFDELERLYQALCASDENVARTLAGLMFRSNSDGLVQITYENKA